MTLPNCVHLFAGQKKNLWIENRNNKNQFNQCLFGALLLNQVTCSLSCVFLSAFLNVGQFNCALSVLCLPLRLLLLPTPTPPRSMWFQFTHNDQTKYVCLTYFLFEEANVWGRESAKNDLVIFLFQTFWKRNENW